MVLHFLAVSYAKIIRTDDGILFDKRALRPFVINAFKPSADAISPKALRIDRLATSRVWIWVLSTSEG